MFSAFNRRTSAASSLAVPSRGLPVNIGLRDPPPQLLLARALLKSDRVTHCRHRRVLGLVLQHQTHRPLTQHGIDLLRNDANLPTRKETASNLGRISLSVQRPALENVPGLSILEYFIPGQRHAARAQQTEERPDGTVAAVLETVPLRSGHENGVSSAHRMLVASGVEVGTGAFPDVEHFVSAWVAVQDMYAGGWRKGTLAEYERVVPTFVGVQQHACAHVNEAGVGTMKDVVGDVE